MGKPLVNKKYLLDKNPGTGGWTYAVIPEVLKARNAPSGSPLFYLSMRR
jgi:hypothetical protein